MNSEPAIFYHVAGGGESYDLQERGGDEGGISRLQYSIEKWLPINCPWGERIMSILQNVKKG